jgi:hypothetical protein
MLALALLVPLGLAAAGTVAPAATVLYTASVDSSVPDPRSVILFATALLALAGTVCLHRRFWA